LNVVYRAEALEAMAGTLNRFIPACPNEEYNHYSY
jgi:hypothetical protein